MDEGEERRREMKTFFDTLWQRGDPWELESSEYEQARYARLAALIGGRRYSRILELGCGAGALTQLLARHADRVVALDVAPAAIAQARARGLDPAAVDFREINAIEYDLQAEGPWDLVVLTETVCYLGWRYSFFEVGWFAARLFAATRQGGRCLLANTLGHIGDWLLLPWLIRTYRDLFLNVGYGLETEETFQGTKNGVRIESLTSVLIKLPDAHTEAPVNTGPA